VFDHVTIRVADRQASERFYAAVLRAVGIAQTYSGGGFAEWDDFSLAPADPEHPVTRRLHAGFAAPSRDAVDAFWRAGRDAGARDGGAPGPRPRYRDDYYGGFLLDPDGNSVEAVHHALTPERRGIDHLWLRVADLGAARPFYETIAPHAGLEVATPTPPSGPNTTRATTARTSSTPTATMSRWCCTPAEDRVAAARTRGLRRDEAKPDIVLSALLMIRRLAAALRVALREQDFGRVLAAALLLIVIGTITYTLGNGWSLGNGFYVAVATLTTSSVLDPSLTITDTWLKVFTAAYILVGIGILVEVVRRIGMGFVVAREEVRAAKASEGRRGGAGRA
jgi:catechol 2,3-dioxygenase-like lactoylglutathione lyase family enzyme